MRFVANSLYLSPSLLLPQPARLCCLFAPSMTNPIERAGRVPRFHSEDAKTRRREQPPAASQRRSVATPRRREQPPAAALQRRSVTTCHDSRHREDAKTRAAPQRRGSVAALQRCEDAKTRWDPSDVAASQHRSVAKTRRREETPAAWQRREVATPRRREQPPTASQRCDTAKTRAAPQRRGSVAALQRCEDAKTRWDPNVAASQHRSVAKTRRREETPAAWQRREVAKTRGDPSGVASPRRSFAASRHREDESSPLSGVAVITESRSLSCIIFENQNANALPSIFLAKFSLMTPLAMPSDFPEAKNLLVLQSSSSSKILLYRKPVGDTGWLKYLYMIVYVYLDVVDIDVRDCVFIIFI